jgi:hypothetical protein
MAKYAVLGSGLVGEVLANGLLAKGHEVTRASREPAKLADWLTKAGTKARTANFGDAARWADTIVLAVSGAGAESALDVTGVANLAGKIVIDATNPIDNKPPVDGVLPFFTTHSDSLMERLQRRAPDARFVKAFSCVGNAYFVDPKLPGGPPTMFICGNDAAAKAEVTKLLTQFGWDTADMGKATAARAIEPLCMLWCIPGMSGGSWTHAFKLLRA